MNDAFSTRIQLEQANVRPVHAPGTVSVSVILRAEGLIELVLAVAVYRHGGGTWAMFAILFLLPDVSMLGYLANPRIGARMYNLGHSYIGPALLALTGFMMATPLLYSLALIWAAHLGFDRLLGYGLKYPTAFDETHLNWKRPRGSSLGLQPKE
jgi:hypothetical protein